MRKTIIVLTAAALILSAFFASGCSILGKDPASAGQDELYALGMKAVSVLEEEINSEVFGDLLAGSSSALDTAGAGELLTKAPENAYAVGLPDSLADAMIGKAEDPEAKEMFDSLSDTLKGQIRNHVSIRSLLNSVTASSGSSRYAASSLYTVSLRREGMKLDKTVFQIYRYSDEVCVIAEFAPGPGVSVNVSAGFVFFDGNTTLEETMSRFGCTLSQF